MSSVLKVDQIQSDTGTVNQTSNLSFTGTGRRITGDMSNTTFANRVGFQSSTTNGNTIVEAIPNGTATLSGFVCNNSADINNAAGINIVTTNEDARLQSFARGTGTPLPMVFFTSGSERMRITTAGVVELTSGQLKFPASQAASSDPNTLDDYEEGTWTPTISMASGTSTGSSGEGTYVKIGRQVTVTVGLAVGTISAGGEINIIDGLPFTVRTGNDQAVGLLRENSNTGFGWEGRANSGLNSILVRKVQDNSAQITTGMVFVGTVTYFTS
jgi:hypothetical protein